MVNLVIYVINFVVELVILVVNYDNVVKGWANFKNKTLAVNQFVGNNAKKIGRNIKSYGSKIVPYFKNLTKKELEAIKKDVDRTFRSMKLRNPKDRLNIYNRKTNREEALKKVFGKDLIPFYDKSSNDSSKK